ncbi:hypothetical protein GEMRC1_002824 [Eukaryota sp. GEM-RC1]
MRLLIVLVLTAALVLAHECQLQIKPPSDPQIYWPSQPETASVVEFSFGPSCDSSAKVIYQIIFTPCARVLDSAPGQFIIQEDGTTLWTFEAKQRDVVKVPIGIVCDYKNSKIISERSTVCLPRKELSIEAVFVTPEPLVCPTCHQSQHEILRAFKWAASLTDWKRTDKWFTSFALHWWFGISTEGEFRHTIRHIDLKNNGLKGVIHPGIGCLRHLKTLAVENNDLFEFPHSIFGMSNLMHLRLSHNHFSTPVTRKVCQMDALQDLYLDNNPLGTEFPVCPENTLTALRQLWLHCTEFAFPETSSHLAQMIIRLVRQHDLYEVNWQCVEGNPDKCPDWFLRLFCHHHHTQCLRDFKECAHNYKCRCAIHPDPVDPPECPIKDDDPVDPVDPVDPIDKQIAFDLRPTSCPNPLNCRSRGVLPAAILDLESIEQRLGCTPLPGSVSLSVTAVDPQDNPTVEYLVEQHSGWIAVDPSALLRWSYENTRAKPYLPSGRYPRNENDCKKSTSAQKTDLALKFDTQTVCRAVEQIEGLSRNDLLVFKVVAKCNDKTVWGLDQMKIVGPFDFDEL